MSAAEALADGFVALFPGGVTVHDGQVPAKPTYPYAHVAVTLPTAAARALSADAQGLLVRGTVTVVAETATGVRRVAGTLNDELDGARPTVPGYKVGRVTLRNSRSPIEDPSVTVAATGRHPMVGVLEYVFVASPTAA